MRKHTADNTTAFRLVIEAVPWHLSDRPTPQVSGSREHPDEWYAYFKGCLSDAGLPNVEPIQPGSRFVLACDLITHPLLERIVVKHLQDLEVIGFTQDDEPSDEVSALDGGIALLHHGQRLIEPSCCGCLSDLSDWQEALSSDESQGRIWVGHPDLGFEKSDGSLTLRETTEYVSDDPEILNEISFPLEHVARGVERVAEELSLLERALRKLQQSDQRMQALPALVPSLLGLNEKLC